MGLSEVVSTNARALRAARRLRQRDVAERAGISRSTVALIEGDGRRVSLEDVLALCEGLDVGLRDLLAGADPREVRRLGL